MKCCPLYIHILIIIRGVTVFESQVTFLSGLGTFIVILGVLLYNIALGIDAR